MSLPVEIALVDPHDPNRAPRRGRIERMGCSRSGITDRFDHFLGYPCAPEPLVITVELPSPDEVARVVVHETSVGDSHEVYRLLVSADGVLWHPVGSSEDREARGDRSFVAHRIAPRSVRFVRVVTRGCHGLTFPSFSRLCEIEAFAR